MAKTTPVKPVAKAAPAKAAPAKQAPGKALATKSQAQSLQSGIPEEHLAMYAEFSGAGLENTTAQDFALPFIYLLQTNSPQVDDGHDKYVEGAAPGMWINTVNNKVYGDRIRVIAVDFKKVFNEWVPRDAGGGFVKSFTDKQEADQNVQDGNQIVETANHYCLVHDEDEDRWEQAIVSLTSTKLKASRALLSRISQVMIPGPMGKVVAPSFAKVYELVSAKTRNEKGTFYILNVEAVEGPDGWVKPDVFGQATDFRAQLQAGTKGADFTRSGEATVVGTEDDEEM